MPRMRRGHGEGSIYQQTDGRWTAALTLGNRKRKVFYGKTRKEVQEKLKQVLHEQQQGTLVTAPQQTVGQFLVDWLENTHKKACALVPMSDIRTLYDCILFQYWVAIDCKSYPHSMYRRFIRKSWMKVFLQRP